MIKKFLWLILVFALCLGFAGTAQAKLVAYYPFDGDTNDYASGGKHGVYWSAGTTTATPNFVTGAKTGTGNAISLRAFDSYDTNGVGGTRIYQGVILPDESFFDFDKELSISLWCKFYSPMIAYNGTTCQGAWAALVQRNRAGGYWCLQTNWNTTSPAQRLSFRIAHPTSLTSTMSVRPGTTDVGLHLSMDPTDWVTPNWDLWYHVVTTYDSTGYAVIYLDSAENRTQQVIGPDFSIVDKSDPVANLAVGIGIYANSDYTPGGTGSSSSYSHDGLIDDVALFDSALTADQVAAIYAADNISKCGFLTMSITESDGSTDVTEGGVGGPTTDSYTIALLRLPDGSDTVGVDLTYDSNNVTVSPTALTFTNTEDANQSTYRIQTVTVTVIDDAVPEGAHNSIVSHDMSSGDDPNFNIGELPDWNVVVHISDNDYKNVVVASATPTEPFDLWEDGPGAEFGATRSYSLTPAAVEPNEYINVKLGAQPSGNVTVTVSSTEAYAYSPTSLVFTTADWYTDQLIAIRGVNDVTTFDGFIDHPDIKFVASGGGFTDANVSLVNPDVFDGYYVENILGTNQSSITDGVYYPDVRDGTSSPGITLWGGYGENEPNFYQSGYAAGWQGKFTVAEANKMVKVTSRFGLHEGLGVTSDYVHEVVLLLDGVRCGEPSTIDPNNHLCLLETNQPRHGGNNMSDDWHDSVRYIPVLNNTDPNHTITLGFWCSGYYNPGEPGDTSGKNTWTGLSMKNFKLEVMDTNEIGIMETLSARLPGAAIVPDTHVAEQAELGSNTDKYSVVLTKLPTGNVTVTVSPDPNVSVDKPSLTFTTANWYTAQTVTITAAENSTVGTKAKITHSASGSYADPAYLEVDITDNDTRGVTVTPTTLAVSENGSPATDDYTVVLTGAPYGGNAVLSLSYDTTEITVSPTQLTFTSTDWMNAQTVTVTVVNDEDFESEVGQTHPATISGSFAGGQYDSITPDNVTVNITDNEKYCGMPNTPYMKADISGPEGDPDCYVDLYDLLKMAEQWLTNNDPS